MAGNFLAQVSTCPTVLFSSLTTIPSSSSRYFPCSLAAAAALTPAVFQLSSRLKALQLTWLTPISNSHALPLKQFNASVGTIRGNPCLFRNFCLPLLLGNEDACYHFGCGSGGGNDNHDSSNSNSGWHNDDDPSGLFHPFLFFSIFICSVVCCFCNFQLASALATTTVLVSDKSRSGYVWDVRGGKWTMLIPQQFEDAFVIVPGRGTSSSSPSSFFLSNLLLQCRLLFMHLMLPEGFPQSVSSDYLDYSLWRGVQGIASQISGVLATQALLYAVGLGKGAIPAAAAVNWVLKDGIGYLSKIMLSKYGRHFDVNPKGWRLFADMLENAAFGMEMLTPACPHLFVQIGAVAGAGRSAATLIQAATRSCFYAGFAVQRNFAEVIAKGEAQGMVSKSIGIVLGLSLANCIGSSTILAIVSFSAVTWVHMFCNLKSYQSIKLRTLNPYRASLVFSEYLISGQAPPVKDVNDEEPLFPALLCLNIKGMNKGQSNVLSSEAKDAAAAIENRLQLGSKLSDVVNNKEDVLALFSLYKNEGYILTENKGRFCVVLKETCLPQDMLKALFHVNYLYWLEKNAGIEGGSASNDCKPGGRLQISLDYVQREFNHVKSDGESMGWVTDGLIARPLPNRIHPG